MSAFAASGFFLETTEAGEEISRESPKFSFGGDIGGVYYLSGVEASASVSLQYRLFQKHAAGAFLSLVFPEYSFELGLDYRFYFHKSYGDNSEDFFRATISSLIFEKFDEKKIVPRLGIFYGRDIPLSNASIAFRAMIGASYLIGESLARQSNPYASQDAHTVLHVSVGILFF